MAQDKKNESFLYSCFRKFRARFFPTYEDLVAEKEWLSEAVWHWQFPDGTHVPQKRRSRLFWEIEQLNRKIKRHPDNPANRQKTEQTAEKAKVSSDSAP